MPIHYEQKLYATVHINKEYKAHNMLDKSRILKMIFGFYFIGQLIQQKRVFVLGAGSLRFKSGSRKLVTRF